MKALYAPAAGWRAWKLPVGNSPAQPRASCDHPPEDGAGLVTGEERRVQFEPRAQVPRLWAATPMAKLCATEVLGRRSTLVRV